VTTPKKSLRICPQGHRYYKSSSCPVCPVCEGKVKPEAQFLSLIAAPARRALEGAGITTLNQLSQRTEAEILALHGMGPSTLPKLRSALEERGYSFRGK
jgi:predicted RecB family nuclease